MKTYKLKGTVEGDPTKEVYFEGVDKGITGMLDVFKEFLIAMGHDIHQDEYVVLFDTTLDEDPFKGVEYED